MKMGNIPSPWRYDLLSATAKIFATMTPAALFRCAADREPL
jgi:hypothetical protein